MKKYHLHWAKSPNRNIVLKKISRILRKQFKNGRKVWSDGTKGVCKPNSGSFKKGLTNHWNKGRKYKNTVGYGNWKDGRTLDQKSYNKYLYHKDIEKSRDKARVQMHNRKTQGIRLTKEVLQRVYEDNIKKFGTLTCYLCFKKIKFGEDSLEHKIPLSRGGTNFYANLAIAHIRCNISKANKTVKEYRKYLCKVNGR